MTGLDTNVLLRFLVKDDPGQGRAAAEVMHGLSHANPGWISLIVLAEVVWSLRKTYRIDKSGVIHVLERLLANRNLVLEQMDIVHEALSLHRTTAAGFADCLLAVSARAAGCARVVTFDRVASRDLGMQQLG